MTQITNGIRSILSHPRVYSAFQLLMGAHKVRRTFTQNSIKPFSGMRILDIGCGPADILYYLQDVEYHGFDVSSAYIAKAQSSFKEKGVFYCQELKIDDVEKIPPFDVVLAMGLIHHLDDQSANNMLNIAFKALKPGGRLLSMDPCFVNKQNIIAKFLIKQDRGENVRTETGYQQLIKNVFDKSIIQIRHTKWIPYTHCIMEGIKN